MKDILLIAYSFPPENVVGAARPHRFYKFLPEFGYRAHVITASSPGPGGPADRVIYVAGPAARGGASRLANRIAIRLGLHEGLPWARWAADAAARLAGQVPLAAVLSSGPPVSCHMAAQRIVRQHRIPWIADFRDPLVFNQLCVHTPLARRVFRYWERRIFAQSDLLLTVSDPIVEHWRGEYPRWAPKMRLLCNGFDPDEKLAAGPIPARPYKVVVHLGSLYGQRDPAPVLDSLSRLMENGVLDGTQLRVRLLGDLDPQTSAHNHDVLARLQAKGCLECVSSHVPRREAMRILAEADYLLLVDNNAGNVGYGIPVKLFEYVQMGRPILALTPRNSPAEQVLARSGVPYRSIHVDDPREELDRAVAEWLALPTSPVRASEAFYSEFDGRRQAGLLAQWLDGMTGTATPGAT